MLKDKAVLKEQQRYIGEIGHGDVVRGLSTRDIEDAFTYATAERVLSKSSISKVTDILWRD